MDKMTRKEIKEKIDAGIPNLTNDEMDDLVISILRIKGKLPNPKGYGGKDVFWVFVGGLFVGAAAVFAILI